MGIRHLQSYLQYHVPDGYRKVSLIAECEKFKSQTRNKPLLLIDLFALIDYFSKDDAETLCGSRFNQRQINYEKLFQTLTNFSSLIFFSDGTLQPSKIDTWISRQNQKYSKCIDIVEKINSHKSVEEIVMKMAIPKTTMHREIIESLATKYGRLIKSEKHDCDTEIAKFASNNQNVLAILSDDSDFLIFSGSHWRFFSIENLNDKTFETMEYNRQALRTHLNLSDEELALLSTFNGNDIINYEKLIEFHESLIGSRHKFCNFRFYALAQFIRTRSLEEMIKHVSYHVTPECLKLFGESVDMYNLSYETSYESDEIMQFCQRNDLFFVSEILKHNIQTFTVSYFDLRNERLQKLPQVYRELLRKQIGILMKKQQRNHFHQLLTKLSYNEDYKLHFIEAIYPEYELPPLMQLLDRKNFPQHDNLRFKLLMWTVSDRLSNAFRELPSNYLRSVPSNYLLDVLVLIFLCENHLITIDDANLVLLTIYAEENNLFQNSSIKPPNELNPQAFNISFLFSKLHRFFQHSLECCGLKDLKKMINFDGVLFQNLYVMNQRQPLDIISTLKEVATYLPY